MTRRPAWLSAAAMGGAFALLATSAAPVFAQGPGEMPAGGWTSYPVDGAVECSPDPLVPGSFRGLEYRGNIESIAANGDNEVVFDLCHPDGAFLDKVAFVAFMISDADYLAANSADKSVVDQPNGTGPYAMDEWRRGSEIVFSANPDYWGDKAIADTFVLRWSSEAGQKLIELQSGIVDGVDNPSVDDLDGIVADPNLVALDREPVNVFYIGMNNTHPPYNNVKVRQAIAMGIDRQRIVDQFYSDVSEVADYFTPCSFKFACEGEPWYEYDPEAAAALMAEGLVEEGFVDDDGNPRLSTDIHLRVVDRSYLPFPLQVAIDIKDQLETNFSNVGMKALIDEQESGTFIDNSDRGLLTGLHLLGWNADYPDPTNFLDYHFGPGASDQFGEGHPDIWDGLVRGATSTDDAVRQAAYTDANNAIKANIPMVPVARGGSSVAWQADVENPQASPLSNERFNLIGPGGDDVLVFLQSGEPPGLFCPDESDGEAFRVCEQIYEGLYAYEVNGTAVEPGLATACEPNEDASMWTCTLREGVTFHDGSTFEAADVVTSYAAAWDPANPLHVGRDGSFTYFPSLWGGFLPVPTEEAAE